MPQPNVNVVIALFEVYLAQRMSYWGAKAPALKTDVCAELLLPLFAQNDTKAKWETKDWIKFAFELYTKEDMARKADTNGIINTITHTLNPRATNLLADTLLACRSYIIECLSKEETFTAKFQALEKRLFLAKNKVLVTERDYADAPCEKTEAALKEAKETKLALTQNLESLIDEKKYIHTFYATTIIIDARNKEFNKVKTDAERKIQEKSWDEFIANVQNNLRPPVLCQKLLSDKKLTVANGPNNNNAADVANTNAAAQPAKVDAQPAAAPVAAVAAAAVVAAPPQMHATTETSALRANSLLSSPKKATRGRKPKKDKAEEDIYSPNDNHDRPVTRSASRRADHK